VKIPLHLHSGHEFLMTLNTSISRFLFIVVPIMRKVIEQIIITFILILFQTQNSCTRDNNEGAIKPFLRKHKNENK